MLKKKRSISSPIHTQPHAYVCAFFDLSQSLWLCWALDLTCSLRHHGELADTKLCSYLATAVVRRQDRTVDPWSRYLVQLIHIIGFYFFVLLRVSGIWLAYVRLWSKPPCLLLYQLILINLLTCVSEPLQVFSCPQRSMYFGLNNIYLYRDMLSCLYVKQFLYVTFTSLNHNH